MSPKVQQIIPGSGKSFDQYQTIRFYISRIILLALAWSLIFIQAVIAPPGAMTRVKRVKAGLQAAQAPY